MLQLDIIILISITNLGTKFQLIMSEMYFDRSSLKGRGGRAPSKYTSFYGLQQGFLFFVAFRLLLYEANRLRSSKINK